MEEKEKFEANKRRNAPFLQALAVLMKEKGINQKEVAKLLKTKSGTFSDYKNGKKGASKEMYDRLARAFGGRLNVRYLTGESQYMMLANVPDEEMLSYAMRDSNPDYDIMEKQRKETEQQLDTQLAQQPHIDPSSQQNASIAAYVQLTNRLEDDLKAKQKEMESRLADKDSIIAEKDARIVELKAAIAGKDARILELERQLSVAQSGDLRKYPFTVGVAEDRSRPPL